MLENAVKLRLVNTQPEHADAAAYLDRVNFPMFAEEGFTADQFRRHVEMFPEGQFVVLALEDGEEKVVATTSTFRTNRTPDYDFKEYIVFIDDGWFSHHEPDGQWLYGVTLSVLPEYRGQGIGRMVYNARRELVRRLNLRGELVAGLIPGYEQHRAASSDLSIEAYVEQVIAGRLFDPTLSMQIRNGFHVHRLLRGYVNDPRTDGVCTLLVRLNPEYAP
jgi:GNAT superfamily N-acetyltransferase